MLGTTKRPFKFPEDLKGVKLRAHVSENYLDTLAEWGAAPTPMAFGEVFTGLQQGTIEGMIGSSQMIWDTKFYEMLGHITNVAPFYNYHIILVNKQFYESLPGDLKKIFDDAVADFQQFGRDTVGKGDERYLDYFEEAGLTVTRLTPEELKVWINATQKTYEKAKLKLGADFGKSVEEFLSKLR